MLPPCSSISVMNTCNCMEASIVLGYLGEAAQPLAFLLRHLDFCLCIVCLFTEGLHVLGRATRQLSGVLMTHSS